MNKYLAVVSFCLAGIVSGAQDVIITDVTGTQSIDQYRSPSLSITLKNAGIVPINSYVYATAYLSSDNVYNSGDYFLGITSLNSLAAGASGTSDPFIDQLTLAPGTYYLIVRADFNNQISETDETNNQWVTPGFVVNTPNIDLKIASLTYSGGTTVSANSSLFPQYQIQNTGTTDLGSAYVFTSFYLSADDQLDANDLLLSYSFNSKLGSITNRELGIPSVTPGSYYLIAHADDLNKESKYNETDENNNTISTPVTIIESNIDLDLTVGQPFVNYIEGPGWLWIDFSLRNNGATGVNNYLIDIYLSSDNVLDASDFKAMSQSLGDSYSSVGASQTISNNINVPLYGYFPQGVYYVILKVNADQAIPETNTNNNVASSFNTITISAPSVLSFSNASILEIYNDTSKKIDMEVTFINNGQSQFMGNAFYNVTIKDELGITKYSNYQSVYDILYPQQSITNQWTINLSEPLSPGDYTITIDCMNGCDGGSYDVSLPIKQTVFYLSGTVQTDDGTPVTQGKLFLYQKKPSGKTEFVKNADLVNNSAFNYQLDDQPYTLYFIPDPVAYPNLVPTILGGTVLLKEESFVTLTANYSTPFVILQIQPLAAGNKIVSGTIDTGAANARQSGGTASNVTTVFSVILMSESGIPVAVAQTDASGHYEFKNLPEGKYNVVVALELDQVENNAAVPVDVTIHNAKLDLNLNSQEILPTTEILQLNQVITFNQLSAKVFGNSSFLLTATSDSGMPISYTSSDISVIMVVNGNEAVIKGAGEALITAVQVGNQDYKASPVVQQSITVNKADQLIHFEPIPAKDTEETDFLLTASSTSELPITFVSDSENLVSIQDNRVIIQGPGEVKITALQEGNKNYNAASPISNSFIINRVTGMDEITKELQFYPNPTKGKIFMTSSASVQQVTLVDVLGRQESVNITDQTIDLANFASGLYFIKVQSNNLSYTLRVIKE